MKPLLPAVRYPGYHRRREIRLREEEDMRAFRREQRRFEGGLAAMTASPDPASRTLIEQLVAEGRQALLHLPLH